MRSYVDHGSRHGKHGTDPIPREGEGGTYHFKLIADADTTTAGDGKLIWVVPDDLNQLKLVKVVFYVTTPSSSGTPTLQMANLSTAADMLTTKVTVDVGEYHSYSAAVPPVIDTTNDVVSTGDRISFDIDVAGTGAKGHGVMTFWDSDVGGYGAKGETGAAGADGANGTNGADGAPGSVWYSGAGAPSAGLGINGDFYLNTSNGDVYAKSAGSWSVVTNLTGPAGSYSPGGTDVALADGGTGASLTDPNADRIMFWDDSAGQVTWLTPGTNLTITGTTIDASGSGSAELPWRYWELANVSTPFSVDAGTWARNTSAWSEASVITINSGYGAQNGSAAQNDQVTWKYAMGAGTWTVKLYVRKSSNTGIVTVLLDGVSVGTLDTYAASAALAVLSLTGISVGSDGAHTIGFKMATKNASSSGYALGLLAFEVFRTA